MTWEWQQPYEAALHEKDPSRLPERLVTAEKAIVQRLQELPGAADDLPETQALREALNRLYALHPHEYHSPGQIRDEETAPRRQNGMRLVVPIGVGLALASMMAWMATRKSDPNDSPRMAAAAELNDLRNSNRTVIPDRGDSPHTDTGSYQQGLPGSGSLRAQDPRGIAQHPKDRQAPRPQSKNPNVSPDAPAVPQNSSAASKAPYTMGEASDNLAPTAQVESARTRVSGSDSAVSTEADRADQTPHDGQSTSSLALESEKKSERPRGTVSVSASPYPSIRVPTELKSESSASAETLQIGQSISRTNPVYPEDAERQHIEGTVKLRAFVGKDGAVENVEVMSGPPQLASNAVDAVRQWRYKPTLLGNRPIEVAQDVTIVFRLVDASDDVQ